MLMVACPEMARTTKSWTFAARPRSWNVRRMNRGVSVFVISAFAAMSRTGLSTHDGARYPPVVDGSPVRADVRGGQMSESAVKEMSSPNGGAEVAPAGVAHQASLDGGTLPGTQ